ncbi:hypothetical protein Glove_146g51 [Diversispora epigaea]|uniref:Uncharacterized protein n=1 Tax=Diversispora epigaea TaxID=1348612 RepID=A0A397IYG5_9GLOM|nr:hypothetical protein Glove_146g51 [Diversispora epigaea]
MASSSLTVPLALWSHLPTAPATTLAYKEGHIVTGLKDGKIWIYRCTVNDLGDLQLQHKVLCIGHKSAITALIIIESQTDGCSGNNYVIISASEDGEVMKWCLLNGRCIMCVTRAFDGIITSIKPLAAYAEPPKFLLCSGLSNEITILNCATLEIVRIWAGHNDWVTCTPFYDSDSRQIRLLTSNFNGILKVWAFDDTKKTIKKVYESVGLLDAQGGKILELISNPYDIGVIMAITKFFVIIIIIKCGKMVNMQRIRIPKEGNFWVNGVFLSKSRVLVSTQNGDSFVYSIPSVERRFPLENGHILAKPGIIRRSSMPNLPRTNVEKFVTPVHTRPVLLEAVSSEGEGYASTAVVTVFANSSTDGKSTSWYLITFRNLLHGPTFSWKSLSTAIKEAEIDESNQKDVLESKWPIERYLSDIWPFNKSKSPKITISVMVNDDQIALGYDNGEIQLMPLSLIFTEDFQIHSNLVKVLKGHIGKVTCILMPNNTGHKYLISGGEDCSIRIWSLDNGKRLASFTYHSQQVTHLFEPPIETCPRIRKCVMSVAKDNSLAIISLEEMSCLYIFGGYPYPIEKIQWRTSDFFIVLYYADESAHFWQTNNLELHQTVTGPAARELIKDNNWITSSVPSNGVTFNGNNPLSSFQMNSQINNTIPLQIFTINIKQLINDIYHYHVSPFGSKMNNRTIVQTEDFDEKPNPLSKIFSWTTNGTSQSSVSASSPSPVPEQESRAIDSSIVQVIMSALMSWNIDDSLDKICFEKLGLKKPSPNVSIGLRGANGNLSIVAPFLDDSHAVWKVSQTSTATRLLSIVGLTRSFLSMKGLDKYTSDIVNYYSTSLPETVGAKFQHSSLSFLAKYFQDSNDDIRRSARSLFSSALNGMPPAEQQSVIDYWKQFLTSPDSYGTLCMARSTILLGMIGADHPKVIPKKVAKNIALSLLLLLHDDTKLSHRLAALELCGRGFSTWESHILFKSNH